MVSKRKGPGRAAEWVEVGQPAPGTASAFHGGHKRHVQGNGWQIPLEWPCVRTR